MNVSFNNLIRKKLYPIAVAAAFAFPVKMANDIKPCSLINDVFNKETRLLPREISSNILEGLHVIADTNFCGGIIKRFDDASTRILKSRILRDSADIKYVPPIENKGNVYLEKFGMYFADRPAGKRTRPHLGLDIFVTPMSRKPKNPVLIMSPVDGVIIASKRAREKDNVIANSVTLLGVDGKKYSFDHLARARDYSDSIPLPKVGQIMKSGDSLGYVGNTGETTLWHLHLTVMTDEMLEKQLKSKYWQDLAKRTPYASLKGQVDPLCKKDAGPIADILNQYK